MCEVSFLKLDHFYGLQQYGRDGDSTHKATFLYLCDYERLNNALLLSTNTNAKIYVPSGVISTSSNSVLGSDSISYIGGMNADICLISCSGISENFELTEVSMEQAMLKKMMLHKAKLKILLCDSNKFSKAFMCDICQTAELDYIITDKMPKDGFTANCNCKVIC